MHNPPGLLKKLFCVRPVPTGEEVKHEVVVLVLPAIRNSHWFSSRICGVCNNVVVWIPEDEVLGNLCEINCWHHPIGVLRLPFRPKQPNEIHYFIWYRVPKSNLHYGILCVKL